MSDINNPSGNTETAMHDSDTSTDGKAETLVVVSKVKKYIRETSGLNTSQCCIDALTRKIVEACAQGVSNARSSNRKTVMGRDIA